MNKTWLVASHHFKKNVMKKSFIFVLLSVPLFVAFTIGMGMLGESMENNDAPIGYVDHAGVLNDPIALTDADAVEIIAYNDEEQAQQALERGDIQAYYIIPETYFEQRQVELRYYEEAGGNARGDFYDFLPYGDGKLAIAVGDVAGKATAAALQGSLAIGTLREHVVSHPCEPSHMLCHMNRRLQQPRLDNRFVAMVFAVYDQGNGGLTVANAGFPRPHLLRDGRVEEIPVQGLPLGILPEPRYEQRALELRKGDVVVFCSDGLKECMDRSGEEFGSERLEALLVELALKNREIRARQGGGE